MADYGHELAFGTFLTPQNQRPEDVIALAQLTEQVGLDFATFQDHPYQSALLDTWTLMTWVAFERAERIARQRGLPAPLARWREAADRAYLQVQEQAWSPSLQAYVQYPGSTTLDAGALVMPLVKVLPRTPGCDVGRLCVVCCAMAVVPNKASRPTARSTRERTSTATISSSAVTIPTCIASRPRARRATK